MGNTTAAKNRRDGVLEFSWETSFWKIPPWRLFAGDDSGVNIHRRSDRASGRSTAPKPLDLARIRAPSPAILPSSCLSI